jgi:hypothetical protein
MKNKGLVCLGAGLALIVLTAVMGAAIGLAKRPAKPVAVQTVAEVEPVELEPRQVEPPKAEPRPAAKVVEDRTPVNGQRDVWSAYWSNSVVAEREYGGKWVQVRGLVCRVEKLRGAPGFVAVLDNGQCLCLFDPDADPTRLQAGSVATAVGRVRDWKDDTLVLVGCH